MKLRILGDNGKLLTFESRGNIFSIIETIFVLLKKGYYPTITQYYDSMIPGNKKIIVWQH